MISTIFNFTSFFWITGFIVGQILLVLTAKQNNLKWYEAFAYGVINLIIMCIGAKILFILENMSMVIHGGISFYGFSLYGAIVFQILSVYLITRIFKRNFWKTGDILILPFLIMLSFYRIDCMRNGCCGGIIINGVKVPTQFIECAFCFVLGTIVYFEKYVFNQNKYNFFSLFFIIYGVFRFIIEFFRERDNLFWLISISHVLSIISIIIGVILLYIYKKRTKKDEKSDKENQIN